MTDIAPNTTNLVPALTHVMDARLHNLDQEVFVFDPSPDVDSLMEHVAALLHCADDRRAHHVACSLTLLRRILESNRAEGGHELDAAGVLDPLVKQLHTNGRRSGLTVKAAAARLREPLRKLDEQPDGIAFFIQCCTVKDVLAAMDPQVARGKGLRTELGPNRHDLLLSLMPADEGQVAA